MKIRNRAKDQQARTWIRIGQRRDWLAQWDNWIDDYEQEQLAIRKLLRTLSPHDNPGIRAIHDIGLYPDPDVHPAMDGPVVLAGAGMDSKTAQRIRDCLADVPGLPMIILR